MATKFNFGIRPEQLQADLSAGINVTPQYGYTPPGQYQAPARSNYMDAVSRAVLMDQYGDSPYALEYYEDMPMQRAKQLGALQAGVSAAQFAAQVLPTAEERRQKEELEQLRESAPFQMEGTEFTRMLAPAERAARETRMRQEATMGGTDAGALARGRQAEMEVASKARVQAMGQKAEIEGRQRIADLERESQLASARAAKQRENRGALAGLIGQLGQTAGMVMQARPGVSAEARAGRKEAKGLEAYRRGTEKVSAADAAGRTSTSRAGVRQALRASRAGERQALRGTAKLQRAYELDPSLMGDTPVLVDNFRIPAGTSTYSFEGMDGLGPMRKPIDFTKVK
ncbi:hypothetical protein [Thalassospira alkalitolerans]|uniref:hypothetical protein n=1 Tax=Thalassospira alkalitolerans TaxID=1293890 RepID=UPI0030EEEA1C|tara:strand:- start:114 stop:1139 length:1026 start_codon:yes stop_codon:yes gene_type:complete